MSYSKGAAEDLAVEAVLFLASRPDLCGDLLASTGLAPDQLSGLAKNPDFCIHILDFILENDDRVLDFTAGRGLRPEEVMHARTALSGPGSFGWDAD